MRPCKFGDNCNKFAQGTCTYLHDGSQGGQGGQRSMGGQGGQRSMGGQRPCKFGDSCHKFAQGACTFLHDGSQGGQGGQGGQRGQGDRMMNPNPNYRAPRNPNYQPNNYQSNQGDFNQGPRSMGNTGSTGGMGFGTQHGNYGKSFNQPNQLNQPNQPNQPGTSAIMPLKGDDFTNKFCRSYQFNQQCKYEQKGKCSRIHGFDEQGKIRRITFSNQIPPQEPSKLGKFVSDGQTYLILRVASSIMLMTFSQQTGQFIPQKTWKFPKPQINYSFYSQKQNFIYISAENPKTTLHDIIIYDMLSGAIILIEQAHQSHVTEVLHFSPDIVLSSSKDGTIRVWKIQGTTAILEQVSTDNLFQTYSTTGNKMQILFLDLSIVNGMKVLSAGTNDNRVLFFLGDQMQYSPLLLPQQHAQAFKIRYCTLNGVSVAFVITWTQDNSSSSVIAITLNDFSMATVTTHSIKQHPRNNIYLIEVIQEKLFVITLQGIVTIYSLPVMTKIGLMIHKNPVNSIVETQYVTKTNIKIPQMFVLQSKYNEKPGSIGVYTVKL